MKKLGVVIGRFQVPELHAGHRHILDTTRDENDDLLILLGTTEALPSERNPLPFSVRKRMLEESYSDATVLDTHDQPSNRNWSYAIDRCVRERFPEHEATLYGSRDSFIPFYEGALPTRYVEPVPAPSGTDIRTELASDNTRDHRFREGLIYAQSLRPYLSYQAVDIAPFRRADRHILLGKKTADAGKLRFIGGFVDVSDASLEDAATRELREEAGDLICENIRYVGSSRIPDPRYRFEKDEVMTAFFVTDFHAGETQAGDDLDEVMWIPLDEIESYIVPGHLPLAKQLMDYFALKEAR